MNEIKTKVSQVAKIISIIKKNKELAGKVECPECADDLYWTKSKYNGHTSGMCSNCSLSWME